MRIGIDIRELEKGKMTGIGRYLTYFLDYAARFDKESEYILFANQKLVNAYILSNTIFDFFEQNMPCLTRIHLLNNVYLL